MAKGLDILYEDEDCLVINKPSGLPTQGGVGVKVSLDDLLSELREPRPLLVHRLDKDTSGTILVAKNKTSAARYARLIAGREFKKIYRALCWGIPKPPNGRIEDPLSVKGVEKNSLTFYRTIGQNGEYALLELELGTGRIHQIRRHLALLGHPILGDDKYGDFMLNKKLRKEKGLRHLLLHAYRLTEATDRIPPLDVQAPLPDYFENFLVQLLPPIPLA
jgi:23S rRNA pseudouridine955/2504/2580 synthase